jgi:hypothetical protein
MSTHVWDLKTDSVSTNKLLIKGRGGQVEDEKKGRRHQKKKKKKVIVK